MNWIDKLKDREIPLTKRLGIVPKILIGIAIIPYMCHCQPAAAPSAYAPPPNPPVVVTGDFNHDNKPEGIAALTSQGTVTFFYEEMRNGQLTPTKPLATLSICQGSAVSLTSFQMDGKNYVTYGIVDPDCKTQIEKTVSLDDVGSPGYSFGPAA